ncbi:hypothetical protein [Ferroacidibacillus organovorans]|nr:hypothetical protein [Ferroacidibacillus organovorans]OPG17370.1 hypothetical protein B2M26_01135 [Ferroacidibacillus organovorans]
MKKLVISLSTIAVAVALNVAPAFANVIHSSGSTGKPTAMGSNAGSAQGQSHRSATGTTSKMTHDGWRTAL